MARLATLAALAAALLAGVLAPAAPALAVTPTVSGVSVAPSSVAIDGLGDALVTVQVDIDEPRGIPTDVGAYFPVTHPGPAVWGLGIALAEVPGTRVGTTATFRGSVLIGSSHAGTWVLQSVGWNYATDNGDQVDLSATPTDGRSVVIVGTHVPTVSSVTMLPRLVRYGDRQWARYTFRHSDGTPLVGAQVVVNLYYGDCCGGGPTYTTDALGQVVVRLPVDATVDVSLRLPSTAQPGSLFSEFELSPERNQVYRQVTALAHSTACVGRLFRVQATVRPTLGRVDLQRLVGRTWRTMRTAVVGSPRPVVLHGLSTTRGPQYFRLRAWGLDGVRTSTSKVFVVRGVRC